MGLGINFIICKAPNVRNRLNFLNIFHINGALEILEKGDFYDPHFPHLKQDSHQVYQTGDNLHISILPPHNIIGGNRLEELL